MYNIPVNEKELLGSLPGFKLLTLEEMANRKMWLELRYAVENLCDWFHLDRDQIKLTRPFLPQRMESYDCQ